MRGWVRKVAGKVGRVAGLDKVGADLWRIDRAVRDLDRRGDTQVSQRLLRETYRQQRRDGLPPLPFDEVEFRRHSQNGEDGILHYLFALLGTTNKRVVEICAGNGQQCNAANLILNDGWSGLLFEGDDDLAKQARAFYAEHPDTFSFPPQVVQAWITRETINDLITGAGFAGAVDLLSLDLDGVDYWIWEAIDAIAPRVVVAEVQVIWGVERAVTVPYRADFRSPLVDGFGIYSGASLPAFVKLGRSKGYRLVGTQRLGFNAFFLRNDVGADVFPEVDASACLDRPFVHWARATFLPRVRDREWVDV